MPTPVIFGFTGGTVTYTVGTTGVYDIVAFGAQGGSGGSNAGGLGAEAGGYLTLAAGATITILVGGVGADGGGYVSGGGGGGSFVVGPSQTKLVIAGGGGGASYNNAGQPGLFGTSGGAGGGAGSGAAGVNGLGGGGGTYNGGSGGGGAGYSGNGGNGNGSTHGFGGLAPSNGGGGGAGSYSTYGSGGFGGGGGGSSQGGGGGGGFSGGGGAAGARARAGGGGGSYLLAGATNTVLTSGVETGNGEVEITFEGACYLCGTRILTARGEILVEHLRPGDLVATRRGEYRPVTWIGQQQYNGQFLGRRGAPVRIRAGALGTNIPSRDLYVSPAHAMVVGDRLVVASLLVNDITITQEATNDVVDYRHIELADHECVLADGAWSESYVERDNRASFHNLAEFRQAYPDHVPTWQERCLPCVERDDDPLLPMLRASLAPAIPPDWITGDADLHLDADGQRIAPVAAGDHAWQFNIPNGVRSLRLKSRAARPAVVDLGSDNRRLGFCVTSLATRSLTAETVLKPDSPALRRGFHPVERAEHGVWRWTDGDAALPSLLFGDGHEDATLTVTGYGMPRYLLAWAHGRDGPGAAVTGAAKA